jgi:hypothetical protein
MSSPVCLASGEIRLVPADEPSRLLDNDESDKTIARLIRETRSNVDKMKSWEGTYKYVETQIHNRGKIADHLARNYRADTPLKIQSSGEIEFVIDGGTDSCWTAFRPTGPSIMKQVGRPNADEIPLNDGRIPSRESVITPEHFLTFRPTLSIGQIENHVANALKGGRQTRIAFRQPASSREDSNASDVVDPRGFFHAGLNNSRIWLELERYRRILGDLQALPGNVARTMRIEVFESNTDSDSRYILRSTINEGDAIAKLESTFSSSAGWNLVEYRETRKMSNTASEELRLLRTVEFRNQDEIFVPSRIRDYTRGGAGGNEFEREYILLRSIVNGPVPAEVFTPTVFKLQDGERYLDQIENSLYFAQNGKLIPAKSYTGLNTGRDSRGILFAVNAVAILVLLILLARKYFRFSEARSS